MCGCAVRYGLIDTDSEEEDRQAEQSWKEFQAPSAAGGEASAGGGAESGGPAICHLCQRRFASAEHLSNHRQYSQLHQRNLEAETAKQNEEQTRRSEEAARKQAEYEASQQDSDDGGGRGRDRASSKGLDRRLSRHEYGVPYDYSTSDPRIRRGREREEEEGRDWDFDDDRW